MISTADWRWRLTACRDNAINDLSPADSPVYITNYDRSVNFSQYKTFSLPDSVIIQSNDNYQHCSDAKLPIGLSRT